MTSEKTAHGLIMVYTGNGKGKTTAAVGQALRMVGQGYKVYMIHFMKGRDYGEFLAFSKITNITVEKAGRDEFVRKENPEKIDIEMAQKGLASARKAIESGEYDLIVLDEINVAMDFNLIAVEEVLELIKNKPVHIDVILTGRNAPKEIIEIADLVSEIKEVKHHYQTGVQSRRGIEF